MQEVHFTKHIHITCKHRVLMEKTNHTHTHTGFSLQNIVYIHTYMAFHFINPSRPIGLGYETCLPEMMDIDSHTQVKYIHLKC